MISYGIDIGTTTLRFIAVKIQIEPFGRRSYEQVGKSFCTFTPYVKETLLDEKLILTLIDQWALENQLPLPEIGTLLFTGKAQKATNALSLGNTLSQLWKGLLTAQLNPVLESKIAALGAGAVELSRATPGKTIIHIDIGGGTSNFARIENGEITDTSCLNIGARMWKVDLKTGHPLSSTPEGKALLQLVPGSLPANANKLCKKIVKLILDHCKGRTSDILSRLTIVSWANTDFPPKNMVLSFSGGVLECLERTDNPFRFGDLGPSLALCLSKTLSDMGQEVNYSRKHGNATALGVSAWGFQISGNSIHIDPDFPKTIKNIPLYTENEFLKLHLFPVLFAVVLDAGTTQAEAIIALGAKWVSILSERELGPKTSLVFLFHHNIAKTFGYYLSRDTTRKQPKIAVLDEIKVEIGEKTLNTLDMTYSIKEERYLVTLKTLRLF